MAVLNQNTNTADDSALADNDNLGNAPVTNSSNSLDSSTWDKQLPDNVIFKDSSSIISDSDDALAPFDDITDLTGPSQKGHNMPQDGDLEKEDLTLEELEGTKYQIPDQDEDDIERSADRNTTFQNLRDTEMLDDKTIMRASDKQIALNGVALTDNTNGKQKDGDAVLVVDRNMDSQELSTMDPGVQRDDHDTGDDTTGQDVDDFERAEDAVDQPGEIVNE